MKMSQPCVIASLNLLEARLELACDLLPGDSGFESWSVAFRISGTEQSSRSDPGEVGGDDGDSPLVYVRTCVRSAFLDPLMGHLAIAP